MQFSQVIGQSEAIGRLRQQADGGRMPHALLFCGPEGCGKLATAWALACRLLCQHPEAGDACGHCPACKMSRAAVHPDLHFAFPVVKPKGSKGAPVSDLYLDAWRQQLRTTPYFDRATWLERMGTENQQAQIYVEESNLILRKLSLKASQGGYKVMIAVESPQALPPELAQELMYAESIIFVPAEKSYGELPHAAQIAGCMDRLGTIESGKLADIAVFDEDPFASLYCGLPANKAFMTICNGEIVYQ